MKFSKRATAIVLAALTISSASFIGMTMNEAAISSYAATTYSKSYYNNKANEIVKKNSFKKAQPGMKLYKVAATQVGNTWNNSTLYSGTSSPISYSGSFVNWCINKAGLRNYYKNSKYKTGYFASPADGGQAIDSRYMRIMKASKYYNGNDLSIIECIKKAPCSNINAAKYNYKVGDIIYLGYHNRNNGYLYSNVGIVSAVNTYAGVKYVSYIYGDAGDDGRVANSTIKLDESVNYGNTVILAVATSTPVPYDYNEM